MKDSSGDLGNTRTMLDLFAREGFDVFVGSERFLLENMRRGGVGCITATGNVNASAIDRLFREWRSPEAERLQEDVNAIRGAIERRPVIPALKAILAHHAGDPAWLTLRPPLVELAAAERRGARSPNSRHAGSRCRTFGADRAPAGAHAGARRQRCITTAAATTATPTRSAPPAG